MEHIKKAAQRIGSALRDRDNKTALGIQIGEITSVSPLEIKLSESITLEQDLDEIVLSNTMKSYILLGGEKVIVIPSDGETFYVIDKVG